VILEVSNIAMISVEMLDEVWFARPHEYIMLRITQMVCKTASKIPCTKHENPALGHGRHDATGASVMYSTEVFGIEERGVVYAT